jgi:tetratricopeptide (TPR) repeat protein
MFRMPRHTLPALCLLLLAGGCAEERRLSTTSTEARAAYTEGVHAWTMFYYTEAEEAIRRSLAADSGFAMAWARLAIIGYVTDDEEKAAGAIARAVALASAATRHEQLFIRAWDHRIGYRTPDALRTIDTLLGEYGDDAEAHMLKGELLEMGRDLEGAIRAYGAAVQADSGFARASMMLGYAYSSLNRQEEALAWMQRYIRLVPDAADPRASYADLLLRVGRYEDALEQYRASLERKPDYWYAFGQIGVILQIKGRLNEARVEILRSIEGLPPSATRDASVNVLDGSLAMLRADYPGAIGFFRAALAQDSLNLSAATGLANATGRLGKHAEALSVVASIGAVMRRRNLEETGWMFGYHLLRANLFLEAGLLDSVDAACADAFDHSTPLTRPSVARLLAETALRRGDPERALEACDEALSVNPNAPLSLLTLARTYRALRDTVMTREITTRLRVLWKDADPDFRELRSLGELSAPPPAGV